MRPTRKRAPRKLRGIRTTIEPRGPFSLAAAARFIAGWPPGQADVTEEQVRLRFLVDDWSGPATVTLTQEGDSVHAVAEADNAERALEQAARIVSLDHDGTGYAQLEDPIVRELQQRSGYLRPVLFHSPYEAAAWSVLSARTTHAQARKLRDALSADGVFAAPAKLLEIHALQGLPAAKLPRLHGIARAALEGRLDRAPLLAKDAGVAYADLQTLPGIGPFYAGLIYIRAVGPTDLAPKGEPRLEEAVQALYGRTLAEDSHGWRPFRTWVSVLIRANA